MLTQPIIFYGDGAASAIPNFTPSGLPQASAIDGATTPVLWQILTNPVLQGIFFQTPFGLPFVWMQQLSEYDFETWADGNPDQVTQLKTAMKNAVTSVSTGINTAGTIAEYLPYIIGGVALILLVVLIKN